MKKMIVLFLFLTLGTQISFAQEKSSAEVIKEALSATTKAMAAEATVMDWAGTILKEGTNGWTCMPTPPDRNGPEPMCLDNRWLSWAPAWQNHETPPKIETLGFGYMLAGAGADSNTDPHAAGRTMDNEWMDSQPAHIMILVPDVADLKGLPTEFDNGGPWVMWAGTPYAHIMAPIK